MDSKKINDHLYGLFDNSKYRLSNTFVFLWESDFFAISQNGYTIEVEVKISKADFKADFKKELKHKMLANHKKEIIAYNGGSMNVYYLQDPPFNTSGNNFPSSAVFFYNNDIPHRFYYAVPSGLLTSSDVPKYAGLIYVNEEPLYNTAKIVKQAPLLHRRPLNIMSVIADKFESKCKSLTDENARLRQIINQHNGLLSNED